MFTFGFCFGFLGGQKINKASSFIFCTARLHTDFVLKRGGIANTSGQMGYTFFFTLKNKQTHHNTFQKS